MKSNFLSCTVAITISFAGLGIGCSSDPNTPDSSTSSTAGSGGSGGDVMGSGGSGGDVMASGGSGGIGGTGGVGGMDPAGTSVNGAFFAPPHAPVSATEIDVWNVPDAPPVGNWSRYLLIVLPNQTFTGTINATGLKYKGVFVIGGVLEPEGKTLKTSIAGMDLPGNGNVFQLLFANDMPAGLRPFVWLDAIDFDTCPGGNPGVNQKSWWGDFIGTGTSDGTKKAYDKWADVIMQRLRMKNFHYFWTTPSGDLSPHSDIIQNDSGGWRNLLVWKLQARHAGQGLFAVGAGSYGPHPEGYVEVRKSAFSVMPQSTKVKANWADSKIQMIQTNNDTIIPNQGLYYGIYMRDIYMKPESWVNSNAFLGVDPESNVMRSIANNKLSVTYEKHPNHPFAYFGATDGGFFVRAAGSFDDFVKLSVPSTPVIADNEVGLSRRVTSKAELLTYLGK